MLYQIYNIYCPQVREDAGYMYGITYESIRSIISNSKLAVIHCSPEVNNYFFQFCYVTSIIFQTLKIVHHSPEFLPYVIFLSAPSPACLKQLGSNKQNEADNDFLSSVSKDYFGTND